VALSGSDAQPKNGVSMALSDTPNGPNGQSSGAGTKGLRPPPVAKVTPWPDGTIAPVTVLAALVGELTCA
jgi:hypothetical protein